MTTQQAHKWSGDKPVIAPNMPEHVYHADPCPEPSLSSSLAKVLVNRSPLHAWTAHPRLNHDFVPIQKEIFDLGRAAHEMLLGGAARFRVIDADNWQTKVARQQRDDAREEGLTPLLAAQHEITKKMVARAREQLADHQCHEAFDAALGSSETSIMWRDNRAGVWCRARLDWYAHSRSAGSIIVYDYKTTAVAAHADVWGRRTLWNLQADMQAAWYADAVRNAIGNKRADVVFRFVVQENDEPYALSVIEVGKQSIELANRKCLRAKELWGQCLSSGNFPGYPARVCHVEAPAWEMQRIAAMDERDPIDQDMVRRITEWQAPL